MKFVQWILVVLGVLIGLILVIGGNVIGFALTIISIVLVLPPLQPKIEERLSFLKSKFLKIFLCIILWFAAILVAEDTSVSLSGVAACSTPTNGVCEQHEIAFLEQSQEISVSATFLQSDTAEKMRITLDYWPEPNEESEVFNEVFDVSQGEESLLFTLKDLELQPGNYRITLIPEEIGNKTALKSDRKFSVWTDPEDVTNRNGDEIDNAGLHNSVSEVKVCEGTDDVEDYCEEHAAELSTGIGFLSFSAEIPSFQANVARTRGDSEITFILRYLGDDEGELPEPEFVFRETAELDREVGTYTLIIEAPDGGFAPGDFELVTSLETRSSKPIRKLFTLKDM
ncbi:hypothetical protein Lepto7376_0783 [[Leptolyngbya] sp. PCC 7376]|uniref:hypothetical protein n=1 Tax=[Leptolyngbya] sp. PCC 7376 TaxID=111781 RepID=UPI00029F05CF|nr:hypothetical protein [[Leptolyngbya] sp. PCC 7376]AFY37180.1 hypothetical protein Lepto7376_0783 [[Leptolyngbya] sp. PCC 7376]